MSTQPDPFAAYGGKAIAAPPPQASPPATTPTADPFAAYGGKAATTPATVPPPPRPQPAQDAIAASLAPHGGEGQYSMHDPSGVVRPIGYNQVHQALDQGFLFADRPTLKRYAQDHAADPLDENRVDKWIDNHPILSGLIQGPIGFAREAAKTATAFDRTPTTRGETEAQLFAATPNKGVREDIGGAAEGAGEFMLSQNLLMSLLGRVGEATNIGQKLKDLSGLSNLVEKYPMIGKLLAVGASSVKAGTIGAAQTFAKTGGDTDAALASGAMNAAAGPLGDALGAVYAGGKALIQGPAGAAESEAAAAAARTAESRAAYAGTARDAAQPSLEQTNAARNVPTQEVMMNQPGGEPAVPSGTRVATATGKPAPAQVNVPQILDQIHDFTGAADRLMTINDDAYNQFDAATGGRFRKLNGEVMAAQSEVHRGVEGADAVYKAKLAQMDALMDSTEGEMTPEMKDAAKAGFRQSYLLRDFGNLWDKNLQGVPGASQASQTQRGINGKGLLSSLQRAVKIYGRPAIEQTLGPGGLENLEDIANANMTATKRAKFNSGVWEIVKHLHAGAFLGGVAGELAGGNFVKGAAAGATAAMTIDVMNAMKTNPKIAQNFIFALTSGATAERFGPFIAAMIQKANTDSSLERQHREAEETNNEPNSAR